MPRRSEVFCVIRLELVSVVVRTVSMGPDGLGSKREMVRDGTASVLGLDELSARELGSDIRLSNDLLQPSTKGAGIVWSPPVVTMLEDLDFWAFEINDRVARV